MTETQIPPGEPKDPAVPAPTTAADPADVNEHELKPGLAPVLITLAAIVVMAGIVAAIPSLREAAEFAIKGDTESLRTQLDGATGVIVLMVLAILHSFVFYPAEILDAAAGFVWGFWLGLLLVMIGWMANAYVSFQIGRHGAAPVLYRIFGRHRIEQLEAAAERGGVFLLLAVRLIPIVPFSLFTIAAGAAGVPLWRLMWTTAIAYIPITALFVYLGTQLEELSPTDPILIGGGIGLVVVVYAGHKLRSRLLGDHKLPPPGR